MRTDEAELGQNVWQCDLDGHGIPAKLWHGVIVPSRGTHQLKVTLLRVFDGVWRHQELHVEGVEYWHATPDEAIAVCQLNIDTTTKKMNDRLTDLRAAMLEDSKP